MIKPMGVLLVLGIVVILLLCLPFALWGVVRCVRYRKRMAAAFLGMVALAIVVLSAWAVYATAPKGARTIAQLNLPDGRVFVVRHYRYRWLEYPKARFYARDADGIWTSFALISELVNPSATSLVLDESVQEVQLPGVGCYRIPNNDFVIIDGSRANKLPLPPGTEPGEEYLG